MGSSFMVLCYAIIGKLIILMKFRQGQLKRAYVTENTLANGTIYLMLISRSVHAQKSRETLADLNSGHAKFIECVLV